jgi:hypothetical protein
MKDPIARRLYLAPSVLGNPSTGYGIAHRGDLLLRSTHCFECFQFLILVLHQGTEAATKFQKTVARRYDSHPYSTVTDFAKFLG